MTRSTWVVMLVALLMAAVSACGGSAEGSGDGAAGTAGTAAPAGPAYDGPESKLPQNYGTTAGKSGTKCVIGYQNLSAQQQSLSAEATGARQEAQRLGCQIKVVDDRLSLTTQVNNFNQFLAQKVDAIVLYPLVPSALQPNINQAAAAKIPVIAIQTPVGADQPTPKGYATSVLQGFDAAAYLRAKAVAAKHPGAKFVVQGLAAPVAALQYFAARQRYWGERFGLKFLGQVDNQDDTSAAATTSMTAALAKYSSMDALFTFNDDSAAADATAVRASGHKPILIAGFNGQTAAFNGIKNGGVFVTYKPDYITVGKLTIDAAYGLITKQNLPLPRVVVAPGTLVTSANVNSVPPLGS